MKRLLSTRFGFFAFAALLSGVMTLVIEPEHRWVAGLLSGLYAILSVLFLLDEVGRGPRPEVPDTPAPDSPYAPPPFIGRG